MEEIVLLEDCSDSLFDAIYSLYETSFPINEQKTKENFKKIFNNKDYCNFVVRNDGQIQGFCIFFSPKDLDFILLEYMAISSNLRSLGIGSKLFGFCVNTLFLEEKNKPILIEIDSTIKSKEKNINQRRANFYRKNGCKMLYNFEYILGLKTQQTLPQMQMMMYGSENGFILKTQLQKYVQDIYERVYFNDRHHVNIEKMFGHLDEKIILI